MVKKLFKLDFNDYSKMMLPMVVILLGIAVFNRIIQIFENDSVTYNIVFVSSMVAVCIASAVLAVMYVAVGVSRFYKNLFTHEGYLAFTLPVKISEHIFSKLFSIIVYGFISLFTIVAAFLIVFLGEADIEIFKAIGYIFSLAYDYFGINIIFWILLSVVFCIMSAACGFILLYGCISIGQLAKKNRVLAAFGAFFAYYIIKQIIGTVFVILLALYGKYIPFEQIEKFIEENKELSVYLGFGFSIIITVAFFAIYYLITHSIIKKHLNIE